MILTDYYKAQKLTDAESRYDITYSTQSYELFESLLINKRKFNVGGLSFNYVPRPATFKGIEGRKADMAITKGNVNISSLFTPNIHRKQIKYGDVNGTNDALIALFSQDEQTIELFIARGYINEVLALYEEIKAGYLDTEIEAIRGKAKDVLKAALPIQ
ncbi:MAG TPA: hypothetical protein VGN63_01300 [Flavisolibacter sp.]|jgi:hypothetical protein|nr:hypothetical protein [Flavisolibacter sp.]